MRRVRSVACALVVVALAAAGLSAATTGAASGATQVKADRNATIRSQWYYIPSSLDPDKQLSAPDNSFSQLFYDSLLYVNGKKEIKPGLATSWNFSSDGLTLTMKLRKGVKFADGTTLDSNAVKMSIERGKTIPPIAPALAGVTSVDAVDSTTVRFNLTQPNTLLLYSLAANPGVVISAKALSEGKDLSTYQDAGTAPYEVVSYEPNKSLTVQRRPGATYWDKNAWTVKRFEFTLAADPTASLNAVSTDAEDAIPSLLPLAQIKPRLGTTLSYHLIQAESTRQIMLRGTRSNFDNLKVRQAVAMAIDRKTLCSNVLMEPFTSQIFPSGSPAYIQNYNPLPYNQTKAKQLIDANGGGFSFETVIRSAAPQDLQIAQVIQQDLDKIGIKMTITPLPILDSISTFAKGQTDAFEQANAGKVDPAQQLADLYISNYDLAGDQAPTLQAMLDKANSLPLGSPQRSTELQKAAKWATDNAWQIPFCFLKIGWVAKKNINGIEGMPLSWAAQMSPRVWWVSAS